MCFVYRIPCTNCEAVYIGETGRKLGTRLSEHKKDSSKTPLAYTRSERKTSLTTEHSSVVTNHIARQNHVIDWEGVTIVCREGNTSLRRLRESLALLRRGTS